MIFFKVKLITVLHNKQFSSMPYVLKRVNISLFEKVFSNYMFEHAVINVNSSLIDNSRQTLYFMFMYYLITGTVSIFN